MKAKWKEQYINGDKVGEKSNIGMLSSKDKCLHRGKMPELTCCASTSSSTPCEAARDRETS